MAAERPAWSNAAAEVVAGLDSDAEAGLTSAEALHRLQALGPNQLEARERRRILSLVVDQFRSVVVLLLIAAGVLAFAFGDHAEGAAILVVVLINSAIGFVTEWRATRSMEALRELGRVDTIVVRDGIPRRVRSVELVPGDLVVLEGGDTIAADLRVLEAAKLQANESALTGESLPVRKQAEPVAPDTPLVERSNMLFKGTSLTRGSCKALVVTTGMATELGRISELVIRAEAQATPLQERLDRLAGELVWVAAGLAILIAVAGIVAGRALFLAVEVAIALAVAAIPEGLPIVATIALARGMYRMARRNAVIARLSAVETLGATSVILTDKTGTLTENRMQVVALQIGDDALDVDSAVLESLPESLRTAVDDALGVATLCSNASIAQDETGRLRSAGDPTEVALLEAAWHRGIRREELLRLKPERAEVPFDPDSKLMATLHEAPGGTLFAVKGAPEVVIARCTHSVDGSGERQLDVAGRRAWLAHAAAFGERGLRTIAVARKTTASADAPPFEDLALLGIVGLEDPPRQGVGEALERCRQAGISVIMVTGDHAATARNVAAEIGLIGPHPDDAAFASGADVEPLAGECDLAELHARRVVSRVSPEQKLRLIDCFQRHGAIVAMTGDGVNDAPALRKADIGIAMGVRGTAVAKEAAEMILQDDNFGTIVEAISQGRAIFENIRKFVFYLLSCNISEVLVVSLATLAGAPLPLLPLQILFLNLVTDVFPALALGVGEGSDALMRYPPRDPREQVLTRRHWLRIVLYGLVISTSVLAAMAIAMLVLGFDTQRAVTVSFCTLALAQLWHVFNMRSDLRRLFDNEITRNPWVWGALLLCLLLVLGAIYNELAAALLGLTDPGLDGWLLIAGFSIVPLLAAPGVRRLSRRR
ncbi:MAG TPA: cation-transporting P-type ATPase [Woeseiaceae bacterium]